MNDTEIMQTGPARDVLVVRVAELPAQRAGQAEAAIVGRAAANADERAPRAQIARRFEHRA